MVAGFSLAALVGPAPAQVYQGSLPSSKGPSGEVLVRPDYLIVDKSIVSVSQANEILKCDDLARKQAETARPRDRHQIVVAAVRACAKTRGIRADIVQEVLPLLHLEPSCQRNNRRNAKDAKLVVADFLKFTKAGKAQEVVRLFVSGAISLDLSDDSVSPQPQKIEYIDPSDFELVGNEPYKLIDAGHGTAAVSGSTTNAEGINEGRLLVFKVSDGCITSVTLF